MLKRPTCAGSRGKKFILRRRLNKMTLVYVKPTSSGRRGMVKVVSKNLYKGKPFTPLLGVRHKTAGRNHHGRITTRHRGGGHKRRYRIIDFRRNKDHIPAIVERLEYDPNRSAHIALLR